MHVLINIQTINLHTLSKIDALMIVENLTVDQLKCNRGTVKLLQKLITSLCILQSLVEKI